MSYEAEFLDALATHGLTPHKAIDIPDNGKLIRFRVTGDKPGSLNGWAVLHGGDYPAGAFGSWKTGATHTWSAERSKPPTAAELAAQRAQREAMRQALATEREAVQAAARTRAQRLWARAKPADNRHPYLVKKRVNSYGTRQFRDTLIVPARDTGGVLHTLQFVSPDGTKRFLTGGRIAGCYCPIGKPRDTLLICEGFATAATVFQATGHATAAAFSANNLLAVSRAMRRKFPSLKIILCADNDTATAGNPGVSHATAAARAIGGFLAVPSFKREEQPCPF